MSILLYSTPSGLLTILSTVVSNLSSLVRSLTLRKSSSIFGSVMEYILINVCIPLLVNLFLVLGSAGSVEDSGNFCSCESVYATSTIHAWSSLLNSKLVTIPSLYCDPNLHST